MKLYRKILSVGCAVSIAVLTVFSSVFSLRSYAADDTDPWAALGEDAVTLRNCYIDYLRSWTSGDLEGVLRNFRDIPTVWYKTLSDGSKAISPVDDWYFYLTEEDKHSGHGGHVRSGDRGGGGSDRPASEVPPEVPSDFFKDVVSEVETFYSPSGELDRISWKNDSRWNSLQERDLNGKPASYYRDGRITIMTNGKFLDKWNCVYLCPYFFDGTDYYYSNKIIFLYFDGDVAGESAFCIKVYDTTNNTISDPFTMVQSFNKSCIDISFSPDANGSYDMLRFSYADDISFFADYSYLRYSDATGANYGHTWLANFSISGYSRTGCVSGICKLFKSSDFFSSRYFTDGSTNAPFNRTKTYDAQCDYGFVCSDAYFYPEVGGYTDLDTEKIPANTTVTITGDTLNDYTYTDNTTGDTTTIKQYITNNYTYPDNGGGSDSGGSGASGDVNVGGNVNVSGNVNVGGQIDINTKPIDINVNVNGNVGSTGTGDSRNPYVNGENVDLTEYLDHVPEISKGFTDYLKDFFAWLPPEIYGLIILSLIIAIWCRLAGR